MAVYGGSNMTFEAILDTMRNPDFFPSYPTGDSVKLLPEDFVFDENQSVKWNRMIVQEHNKLATAIKENYWNKMNDVDTWFNQQVRKSIQNEIHVSEKVAGIIFNQAYEDSHANGYHEVVLYAQRYCKFIQSILNAMKED